MKNTGTSGSVLTKTDIKPIEHTELVAGQKKDTGLFFLFPATPVAIDDINIGYSGWIVFEDTTGRWKENDKIPKIQTPNIDNLAKINSDGELEDSGSSIADIQAALDLKANSDDLRQDSTFFVDDLIGSNSNDGKSLDKPFATVAKGIVEVESYSILKINGQGNKSGTASFSSSQNSITVDISPAVTINGTIGLVNGNTYMSFKNGKISATINDLSGGRKRRDYRMLI